MTGKEGQLLPTFENAVTADGKIYFSDNHTSALYSVDCDNKVSLLCRLEYSKAGDRAFGTVLYHGGRLYAAPCHDKAFLIYDTVSKEDMRLELPLHLRDIPVKFLNSYLYEDNLFFVGGAFPGIAILDAGTDELTIWDDWVETANGKMRLPLNNNAFFRKTVRVGDIVYAPMCESNTVFLFDLRDKSWRMETVGSERCSYTAACYSDGCLYLAPREMGPLVRWNLETGEAWEYDNFPKGYEKKLIAVSNIVPLGDSVLMIPMQGSMMVLADRGTGKMKEFAPAFRGCGGMDISDFGDRYFLVVRRIINQNSTTFYIDKETQRIEEAHLTYPETERKYFSRIYRVLHGMKNLDNRYLGEVYQGALEDYLAYVTGLTEDAVINAEVETTGEKIFEAVRRKL